MPKNSQLWPEMLWILRHGESAGNLALAAAEAAGAHVIDILPRDMDVPLSPLGERQAAAVGHWFGQMPAESQPTLIVSSPYHRALSTATIVARSAGLPAHVLVDERIREKELGQLNRLTKLGIVERFPAEVERRNAVGKFYYRPPEGESWCDVVLRLRSVLHDFTREYSGERVLIVSHQVIVTCLRYVLERLTESEVLAVDRTQPVPNCSITAYEFATGRWPAEPLRPVLSNFVAPLQAEGQPVTTERDATTQTPG